MKPRSTSVNGDVTTKNPVKCQVTPLYLCMGSACYHHGSPEILEIIQDKLLEHHLTAEVELMGHFCLGACKKAVLMRYGKHYFEGLTPENAAAVFEESILPLLKGK